MQRVIKLSRVEMISRLEYGLPSNKDFAIISINDTQREANEVAGLIQTSDSVISYTSIVHPDDCSTSFIPHVKAIKQELDVIHGTDTILLVHCWAGISRSAAVAKFAEEYLDVPAPQLLRYKIYNNVIYNTLKREIPMR